MPTIPWIMAGADQPLARRDRFRAGFSANEALQTFLRRNPLVEVDDEEVVVVAMLARMGKTHAALLGLCRDGYGVPAAMLNRSMTEDLLVGFWARKHPREAQQNVIDHDQLQRVLRNAKSDEFDVRPLSIAEEWTAEKLKAIKKRFSDGKRNISGMTLYGLRDDVLGEFPTADQKSVQRLVALTNQSNNALLHASALALNYSMTRDPDEPVAFDVTPSDVAIAPTLAVAYWLFSRMLNCAYGGRAQVREIAAITAEFDPLLQPQLEAI